MHPRADEEMQLSLKRGIEKFARTVSKQPLGLAKFAPAPWGNIRLCFENARRKASESGGHPRYGWMFQHKKQYVVLPSTWVPSTVLLFVLKHPAVTRMTAALTRLAPSISKHKRMLPHGAGANFARPSGCLLTVRANFSMPRFSESCISSSARGCMLPFPFRLMTSSVGLRLIGGLPTSQLGLETWFADWSRRNTGLPAKPRAEATALHPG